MKKEQWREVRLGEVILTNASLYSEKDNWSYVNYLDTGNISENRIEQIQTIDLKNDKLPSRARRKVNEKDIVYSTVRPIQRHYGILKNIPENFLVSTGFTTISATEKVDSAFIYYYLIQNKIIEYLQTLAEQTVSTYPLIKSSNIENLQIHIPPLPTQRVIAATLSCLDEKIEVNNWINANLEAQAQAIFKSWFETQDAKSWKYGKLSDVAIINPERSLKKGVYAPYLEMANLPTHGSFPSKWEMKEFSGGMKFKNGDTILARITPCLENGKTAYINFMKEGEIGYGSTEYVVLSARDDYPNEILYFLARTENFRNYAIKNMTGTSGRQRVSADIIGMYKLRIPSKNIIEKYKSIFVSYMSMIRKNSLESRALAAIRDALLPKLMSGEIEAGEEEADTLRRNL